MGHGPPPDGAEVDEGRFLAVLHDVAQPVINRAYNVYCLNCDPAPDA